MLRLVLLQPLYFGVKNRLVPLFLFGRLRRHHIVSEIAGKNITQGIGVCWLSVNFVSQGANYEQAR